MRQLAFALALSGLAYTANPGGAALTGSNDTAREDAVPRVLAFMRVGE